MTCRPVSNPSKLGDVRDGTVVSAAAARRQIGQGRNWHEESPALLNADDVAWRAQAHAQGEAEDKSIRGSSSEDMCERFNRQLREG